MHMRRCRTSTYEDESRGKQHLRDSAYCRTDETFSVSALRIFTFASRLRNLCIRIPTKCTRSSQRNSLICARRRKTIRRKRMRALTREHHNPRRHGERSLARLPRQARSDAPLPLASRQLLLAFLRLAPTTADAFFESTELRLAQSAER